MMVSLKNSRRKNTTLFPNSEKKRPYKLKEGWDKCLYLPLRHGVTEGKQHVYCAFSPCSQCHCGEKLCFGYRSEKKEPAGLSGRLFKV
jgi:hypothetical protein